MLQYCCDPQLSNDNKNASKRYPYSTVWNVEEACAFDTCTKANKGNPDLGGIGVCILLVRNRTMDYTLTVIVGHRSLLHRAWSASSFHRNFWHEDDHRLGT